MREGCPNCDNVLGLRGNNDAIQECTSQVFEGLVTLRDPNTSWVARWQRLDSYVPGTYAVKVTGSVCFIWVMILCYLLTRFGTDVVVCLLCSFPMRLFRAWRIRV